MSVVVVVVLLVVLQVSSRRHDESIGWPGPAWGLLTFRRRFP